jgi:anti-anti-sigma factor
MAVSDWKEGEVHVLEFKEKLVCGDGDTQMRNRFGELLEAGGKSFVFDLSDVPYIDSAVVGEIVNCAKRARLSKGELRLVVEPKGRVEDMLRLCSLDRVLDLYPDRPAALAASRG